MLVLNPDFLGSDEAIAAYLSDCDLDLLNVLPEDHLQYVATALLDEGQTLHLEMGEWAQFLFEKLTEVNDVESLEQLAVANREEELEVNVDEGRELWIDALEAAVEFLQSKKVFVEKEKCPFEIKGVRVLALLTEDGHYHPAVTVREMLDEVIGAADDTETNNGDTSNSKKSSTLSSKRKKKQQKATRYFEVNFLEYSKLQLVKQEHLIYDDDTEDGDIYEEDGIGEGECEICKRFSAYITFHHLVPKSTHRRWLRRRRWPDGVDLDKHLCRGVGAGAVSLCASSSDTGHKHSSKRKNKKNGNKSMLPPPNRTLLNCYGAMLCGRCHSQVHKTVSNDVLALQFNTVDALLKEPRMQAWLTWRK